MTSCGGMLSVIVRRSTLTIRSTIGIRRKRPGPFGGSSSRPRRNTTPRSYSRATLIAEIRKSRTRKTRNATRPRTTPISAILRRPDAQDEPVHVLDPDVVARPERRAVEAARAPELPADGDEAVISDLGRRTYELVHADRDRPAPHLDRLRERERPEAAEDDRDGEEQRQRDVVARRRDVEEQ